MMGNNTDMNFFNISYDENNSTYVGSVEEIAKDFSGRTVDEALKRFHAVVDRHISFGE